ncbi:MAG: hypothetical protein AAGE93_03960 [Bacteroidota bacterium]
MTNITWIQRENIEYLKISFVGIFTYKDAEWASQQWKEQFQAKPEQRIKVIFDALEMINYEPSARSVWQQTIAELSGQIDSIWLVTDSKLIVAGAKIMSIFTSFRINTVSSEDKVYEINAKLAKVGDNQTLREQLA